MAFSLQQLRQIIGPPVQAPAGLQIPGVTPPPAPAVDPSTGAPYPNQETAGAYTTPTQAQQQIRQQVGNPQAANQAIHNAARQYALQRIAQFRRVQQLAGSGFGSSFSQADLSDPIHAYALLSAAFAAAAHHAGYADPRVYLRDLLGRYRGSRSIAE